MNSSLDTTGFSVKLENDFDGIGIYDEEYIRNFREKGIVYDRGIGIRICFGVWVQCLFT